MSKRKRGGPKSKKSGQNRGPAVLERWPLRHREGLFSSAWKTSQNRLDSPLIRPDSPLSGLRSTPEGPRRRASPRTGPIGGATWAKSGQKWRPPTQVRLGGGGFGADFEGFSRLPEGFGLVLWSSRVSGRDSSRPYPLWAEMGGGGGEELRKPNPEARRGFQRLAKGLIFLLISSCRPFSPEILTPEKSQVAYLTSESRASKGVHWMSCYWRRHVMKGLISVGEISVLFSSYFLFSFLCFLFVDCGVFWRRRK